MCVIFEYKEIFKKVTILLLSFFIYKNEYVYERMRVLLQIVACVTSNGGIGKDNDFIVKTDEYFNWLVEEVEGTIVVVGKRTYELGILPEEVYENEYYVITEEVEEQLHTLDEQEKDVSVLGGTNVFHEFIEHADVIKCAEIDGYFVADEYFPEFDLEKYGVKFIGELEKKHGKGVIKEYYRKEDEDV